MLNKLAFSLTAALCLAVATLRAQPADTLSGKVTIPARTLSRIQFQSSNLGQQISRQSLKYLNRMAGREQQLQQRLAATDSTAAKALFGTSQAQYAALAARLKNDSTGRSVPLSGQYMPYADTLQGAMGFLKRNPQLLTKAGDISSRTQARLQAASGQFQLLQAKMQDADMIKAYVQSRQEQISQYLSQHSDLMATLAKPLAGMQQEEYYYSQRIAQYKALLSDPDAMVQKALSLLGQLPAFQAFMSTHSQLGSLFHVPGNFGDAQNVNGLQTKEQVAQIVQNHLPTGGTGAMALQTNLQNAQSELNGYKDRLQKLGIGNGDAKMPNFKPNDQKTKSFLGRLQYGFDFQATHYSNYYPSLLSLGLSLGYKLGHSNVVGVGVAYELGTGNGIRDVHLTSQGLGLRSFLTIKLKGSFSATGGFEYNYVTPFTTFQQLKQIQYWQQAGLIGVTKTISTKSKFLKQTTFSLLWDVLSYQQIPRTQPVLFRMGYNL